MSAPEPGVSSLRSLTGSLVFSVDVTQSGTYTVECADNDDDAGEVRYFDDYARVIAFIADRVRAHYAATQATRVTTSDPT